MNNRSSARGECIIRLFAAAPYSTGKSMDGRTFRPNVTKLMVRRTCPEVRALWAAAQADGADVTFINLGADELPAAGFKGAIPGEREQAVRFAAAQAMRAFTAHSGRARGFRHAAGKSEDFEEAELAGGSPAVEALFDRLHRPAWSTMPLL